MTNFIGQYYLPDVSIGDNVIDYYELTDGKREGTMYLLDNHVVDKSQKDSVDLVVPINGIVSETLSIYFNGLQKCLNKYIDEYNYSNTSAPFSLEDTFKIQKYNPNGAFHSWHFERGSATFPVNNRHLVFMTYLNDVTDGGETEFYYQGTKVQPRKGLTLIWPADWTHTHRGIPSATQTKYIITGWLNYI